MTTAVAAAIKLNAPAVIAAVIPAVVTAVAAPAA